MSKQKTMDEILGDIRNSSEKEKKNLALEQKAEKLQKLAEEMGLNIIMHIVDSKGNGNDVATVSYIPFPDVHGEQGAVEVGSMVCHMVRDMVYRMPWISRAVKFTLQKYGWNI